VCVVVDDEHTGFIVVIKRMPHEVDVFGHGLAGALPEDAVVQEGEGAGEGPAVLPFTQVDVTVTSASTNTNVPRIGARLAHPEILALGA
jgi:hypothetical protein